MHVIRSKETSILPMYVRSECICLSPTKRDENFTATMLDTLSAVRTAYMPVARGFDTQNAPRNVIRPQKFRRNVTVSSLRGFCKRWWYDRERTSCAHYVTATVITMIYYVAFIKHARESYTRIIIIIYIYVCTVTIFGRTAQSLITILCYIVMIVTNL